MAHIMGRNLSIFNIFDSTSLVDDGLASHTGLDVSDAQFLIYILDSNVSVTIYPQVSDDNSNWYDLKAADDSDITPGCNNEKVAIPVEIAARYFRIVVHNASGSTATLTGRVMART